MVQRMLKRCIRGELEIVCRTWAVKNTGHLDLSNVYRMVRMRGQWSKKESVVNSERVDMEKQAKMEV